MATNYPSSLDTFTNPAAGNSLNAPSHAGQHANVNDAVEALQAKLGTGTDTAAAAATGTALVKQADGTVAWDDDTYLSVDTALKGRIHDVKAYGAVGDGVVDDTTAVQAAIDGAQTAVVSNTYGSPIVYFPPGNYRVTSGLTVKSAPLIGDVANNGVRVTWDAVGGTCLTKSSTHAGGMSFWLLEGINFRQASATNRPATWLDLTASAVDVMFRLRDVHFAGCSGSAIKMNSFYNCHWEHLRFDSCGEYAIHMSPINYLGSFRLDGFTYDNGLTAGTGKGVLHIDCSAGAVSNLGPIELANGRIELNAAWAAPKAVIVISQASVANSASIPVVLRDVAFQDVINTSTDFVFYRDTANTAATESVVVINCFFDGLSAVWGGTLSTSQRQPTLTSTDSWNVALYADGASQVGFANPRVYNDLTVDRHVKGKSLRIRDDALTDDLFEITEGTSDVLYWRNIKGGADERWAFWNISGNGGIAPFAKGIRFSPGGTHALDIFATGRVLAAGELEVDGALNHDGSTVGFYGATPVSKAANPGTAAGTDAAVINAIVTALRNLGLVT